MSTETKYLIMEELIGIPAAAIEKADEQAGRIIEMVRGEGRFARPKLQNSSIPCSEESLDKIKTWMGPSDPDEDFTANSHPEPAEYKPLPPDENIRHPEFRPKHTTKPTRESLKLTEKIAALRAKGLHWHQIAAKVGLSKEAARKRYRTWEEKQPVTTSVAKLSPDAQMTPPLELFEPGAEEAAAEAALAEEVLKSAPEKENSPSSYGPTVVDEVDRLTAGMDDEINTAIGLLSAAHAFDIDIKQSLDRKFPGHGLTVADIRARRHS